LKVDSEVKRIVKFIQELVKESKSNGIVVGLSGGIDSALTAALSVEAVRSTNVQALILPIHSIEADIEDAKLVSNHLKINYILIDLSTTFDHFIKSLSAPIKEVKDLTKANLKPRMRMCSLYFFANQLNYLVAGTGNRSEDEIGYFTKYGDGGVDFLPIQHLYKHEVREMARYLKLPEKIINRKPSAGLWEGQTDEGEISQQLGFPISYDTLDEMLENIDKNTYNPNNPQYKTINELRRKNRHKLALPPALKRVETGD